MTKGKGISLSLIWPMEGSGNWLALGIFVLDLITSTVGLYDKSLLFKWVNTSAQHSVEVLTLCGVQEILNYFKRTVSMAPCSALLKKTEEQIQTAGCRHFTGGKVGRVWLTFVCCFGAENADDGWFQRALFSLKECVFCCAFGFWLIHNSLWTCC